MSYIAALMSDSDPPRPGAAEGETKPADKPKDVVYVHGETPNGLGIARMRTDETGEGRIEIGELRPLKEGQPLVGEVVRLSRREESDRLFDVEVMVKASTPDAPTPRAAAPRETGHRETGHKGPPRVTSNAFRHHWDDVFGPKTKRDPLPN